jgi:multidrug efflux pump subunit AcrA (membrane-fusion protein)
MTRAASQPRHGAGLRRDRNRHRNRRGCVLLSQLAALLLPLLAIACGRTPVAEQASRTTAAATSPTSTSTPTPTPARAASAAASSAMASASASASGTAAKAKPSDTIEDITLDESAQREAGILVEPVRETLRPYVVQATGQLTSSEDATWRVGAMVDGRVAAVLVGVGDRVTRGQPLARVHSHEVHEARATYQLAKADLERQRMLADQAQRVRDRARRLFELKAASREQVEAAETGFRDATIAIANAQTALDKARVHITEFLDIALDDEAHEAHDTREPRAARETQARPAAAHDDDFVPIKSPAAGTVMERLATSGTVVSPGEHVFTVADLSTLWMIAAVNEADLSRLQTGQPARVSVKAYPGEAFTGRVIKLGEALDTATRTLQVRVALPNPQRRLKPQMFATVAIDGPRTRASLFVPPAAVQEMRGDPIVFVRTAPTRFAVRRVSLGETDAGDQEITAGLRPGDQLVTRGAFLLKTELLKHTLESD